MMGYTINEKLEKLIPYEPITGEYPIRLDANESYLPISKESKKLIKEVISEMPFNRYPDPNATAVCEAFSAFYSVDPAIVTAGNGSDELISVIMNSFLEKGDTVMTMAPDFSMYKFYASLAEANVYEYQKCDNLTINSDDVVKEAKENNVKLIIFSNPCNPTSVGLEKGDVRKIIAGTDALVVLDEAYMDFYSESLLNETAKYENLIVLKTASKAVGAAAIRLGFAVSNYKLTYSLKAAKSPYNVNTITQAIGEIIYSDRDYLRQAAFSIKLSALNLYEELSALNAKSGYSLIIYKPDTNFVYIKTDRADEIYNELLKEGIIIRNMGGYLRITTGNEKENKTLLKKLKKIL